MPAQGFREIITQREWREGSELLARAKLDMPSSITAGIGFYEDGELLGTAFLSGNLVCGICVAPDHQGEGLATSLVARIMSHAFDNGLQRLTIVTKAEEADKFAALGFHLIASTDKAALLEYGHPDYASWITKTRTSILNAFVAPNVPDTDPSNNLDGKKNSATAGSIMLPENSLAAIVINANPFTNGHRYLVEKALARYPHVVVFVVEEDASVFPFSVRIKLVSEGLADLPSALVIPAGPYMVSRSSFPAYFTGKEAHAAVYAGLDSLIFASRIAPDLGICARFVGSEPLCGVTSAYNDSLRATLGKYGVVLTEVQRKPEENGKIISASLVRDLMLDPLTEAKRVELQRLVPPSTMQFLLSEDGRNIAALWNTRNSRH